MVELEKKLSGKINREVINAQSIQGLVVCAGRNSHKPSTIAHVLKSNGLNIPVVSARPDIPEPNYWTAKPDIVSALKTMELPSLEPVRHEVFLAGVGLPIYPDEPFNTAFVATDIMVEMKGRVENQPPHFIHDEEDRIALLHHVARRICSANISPISIIVRVGIAVNFYEPGRGVLGLAQRHAVASPCDFSELAIYILGAKRAVNAGFLTLPDALKIMRKLEHELPADEYENIKGDGVELNSLTKVNAGIRWQLEFFNRLITEIDGVQRYQQPELFVDKLNEFINSLMGGPREFIKVLRSAIQFSNSFQVGGMTAPVRQAVKQFNRRNPQNPIQHEGGNWEHSFNQPRPIFD